MIAGAPPSEFPPEPFLNRALWVKVSHALQQATALLVLGGVHYGLHHLLRFLLNGFDAIIRLIDLFSHTIFTLIYFRLTFELLLIFFPGLERWLRRRLDGWLGGH